MINAEIDRMLQEEENTMAETLYDKYMADPEFAAMMKHEDEIMILTERIAYLEAQLADIYEAHEQVMSEKCPTDEVHCTCVPYLRQEIKDLRAKLSELREAASQVYDRYCRGTSYTNEDEKWKRALRALLDTDKSNQ